MQADHLRLSLSGILFRLIAAFAAVVLTSGVASAGDWPQWCGRSDRNMASDEKGLPDHFDEVTGTKTSGLSNVKWVAPLGSATFGSPVIAGGKVFIGGGVENVGQSNAIGVLWCFRESDGELLWRMQSPFRPGLYNRSFGICATPAVEGGRVYLANHLGDVLCLRAGGRAGASTQAAVDEAQYFSSGRKCIRNEIDATGRRILEWTAGTPAALGPKDASVLWAFDMVSQARCWPYNAVSAAPLIRGDRVYVATGSTDSHRDDGPYLLLEKWKSAHHAATYESPSLIVLDKTTGKLLAADREGIFEAVFHGAHSSPAFGTVNGKELLFYGGGNGTCYAFDPGFLPGANGEPGELKRVWKFNCLAPATYNSALAVGLLKRAEIIATPVFYENRVYVAIGNDLTASCSSAGPGRLLCIDATGTGDITLTGKVWSFDQMRSSSSTVAIADGLVYAADAGGSVYCLDAETGQLYWQHQMRAAVWGSPLAADGKVYVGTHGRGLVVLAQGREKKVICEAHGKMDIVSSPAAANGVLYVASQGLLYALATGASGGLVGTISHATDTFIPPDDQSQDDFPAVWLLCIAVVGVVLIVVLDVIVIKARRKRLAAK